MMLLHFGNGSRLPPSCCPAAPSGWCSPVKRSVNLVQLAISKERRGGKQKQKTCTVKHNTGVDLLSLPQIPERYKEHGVKTPLVSPGVLQYWFSPRV